MADARPAVESGLFELGEIARISAIRPIASRPGTYSILASGRVVARASERTIAGLGVRVGTAWTGALAGALRAANAEDRAERDGARLLARRSRSEADVRARLLSKGHAADAVEGALRRLCAVGAINDAALAERLVEDACSRRPVSRRAVRDRAERAGIGTEAAERAFERTGFEPDSDMAVRIVRERVAAWLASHGAETAARRAFALLARRGFGEEDSEHAVRLALREAGADLPDT